MYIELNSYLSHCIIDSFPRISKYQIKTSFIIHERAKSQTNKTSFNNFSLYPRIAVYTTMNNYYRKVSTSRNKDRSYSTIQYTCIECVLFYQMTL